MGPKSRQGWLAVVGPKHRKVSNVEKGKIFRFPFTRDAKSGVVSLGKPIEMKQVFVPAAQNVEKSEDPDQHVDVMLEIYKAAWIETEEHPIDHVGWDQVLGTG